ncbi:MAG: radical SAM protein [Deltaproteobacteria bacterium]|nr:radical SAM protein [Deltaproteobacteria bacterium]
MKVLLINPPGWQKGSTNLGLCYLASSLLAHKHKVLIFDVNATDKSPEAVAEKALEYAPDIIGFSLKTSTANAAFLLSKAIKKRYSKAIHVAGGAHITLAFKESLLGNPDIEYCFLGESERSFIAFVERLQDGRPVEEVPGIAYKKGGEVVVTPREYIEDLDSIPYPNLEVIENFSFKDFRYPMITSRGCPYPCTYCCVGVVSSKKWRARTPENIIEELKAVKERHGITSFEILDDNFTLRVDRAKKFCRLLIESGLNLSWYCHNGIRADKLDLELAKLMKEAGCTSVALGVESGDPLIFDSIKKGEPLEAIVNAVKCIKEAGMKAVGYFIIGLPGDSLEGIKNTIKFQKSLGLDHYTYGILNPYPYTEVYDTVKREGRMLMDIKESSHFSTTLTIPFEMPGFSRDDMEKAYYLARFQKLYDAIDNYEKKYKKRPERILYVDFAPASKFTDHLAKLLEGYELDVFCFQWRSDNYFKNRDSRKVTNLHVYVDTPYLSGRIKKFIKMFNLFRKRDYSMVFYNTETPQILLPPFLLIVRPKAFYLEAEDGATLLTLKDKEIKALLRKKAGSFVLTMPKLAVSLLVYPFFRLALIGFGFFLCLKKDGKAVDFTPDGPKFKDIDKGV